MNRMGATTIFQTRIAAMIIPTILSRFLFESDIPFNTAMSRKGFKQGGSPELVMYGYDRTVASL